MDSDIPWTRRTYRRSTNGTGFSLVEVCLALGIVAFALIPLVGLLSVGLDSYRNSNMRGRAAQAVSQVANCIRLAKIVTDATTGKPSGVYVAASPMDNTNIVRTPTDASQPGVPPMHWSQAASPQGANSVQYTIYFDANGEITTPTASPQMIALVVLTPPTSAFDAGTAQIAVAWPVNNAPTYDASSGITFTNPQGHEDIIISFIPNSP